MPKHEERRSLASVPLPPPPTRDPVIPSSSDEARVMNYPPDTPVKLDSGIGVKPEDQLPRYQAERLTIPRQKKAPTSMLNAKIPVELHTRLKRTAQFNEVQMVDILVQALEIELGGGKYKKPPQGWGGEE
jgi:hypothetical protein